MNRLFTHRIQSNNISFKYANGVSDKSGKEFHLYHEIVYFLGGDAEFISEHYCMRLPPDTLILIPKETYHQMVIHNKPEQYVRCVIQFYDMADYAPLMKSSMQTVSVIKSDDEIKDLFQKAIAASKDGSEGSVLILKSVLALLLHIIPLKERRIAHHDSQNSSIQCAIDYINANLSNDLSVSKVAMQCNMSASSLSHLFRQEMNTSLHQFIIKKRLMAAHHQIASGEPAAFAAAASGFHDYSGFYKQYKKMFGVPPSHTTV